MRDGGVARVGSRGALLLTAASLLTAAGCRPAPPADEGAATEEPAPPTETTWSTEDVGRLCFGEGPDPLEPCAVVEQGLLNDGLRYALYDLRRADEMDPPTQDSTFLSFRARNAAALFERTADDRWRRLAMELPADPTILWYETPTLTVAGADTLLFVPIRWYGTGRFNDDRLWARRGDAWRPVETVSWMTEAAGRLPATVEMRKGIEIDARALVAESELWVGEDPNCCPSGGSFRAELGVTNDSLVVRDVRYFPPR